MNLHLLVYSWYVHSGACLIPPLSVESVVGSDPHAWGDEQSRLSGRGLALGK